MTLNHEPHEVLGVSRFAPWADVRAAYLTLVRRYHPDGSMTPDSARMAAVNVAYETLERRRLTADGQPPLVPMGPGTAASGLGASPAPKDGSLLSRVRAARHAESPLLDFGQYAGWRIADVAAHDPRYLRWLSRHSSGIRFRRAIELVLGPEADLGRRAAVIG